MSKKILITGAAGFIGFNLCQKLIKDKISVIGIDNLNSYYDMNLKKARLKELNKNKKYFKFFKIDVEDTININKIFQKHKPNIVFNLAAQAGVRYSIENPKEFINTNIN